MNHPTEIEMAMTRQRLQEWPADYLEAVAIHHSRVARAACYMKKLVDASRYVATPQAEHLEFFAQIIERSFADAFGVRLRSATMTEPRAVVG